MLGTEFTNFYRTLNTCVNVYLADSFKLIGLDEPKPTEAQVAKFPEISDEARVPNFITYILQKA